MVIWGDCEEEVDEATGSRVPGFGNDKHEDGVERWLMTAKQLLVRIASRIL